MTTYSVKTTLLSRPERGRLSVHVVTDLDSLQVLLHPLRIDILEALRTPASAATVARGLNLPRQKVNYHLKELERAALVREVETGALAISSRRCTKRWRAHSSSRRRPRGRIPVGSTHCGTSTLWNVSSRSATACNATRLRSSTGRHSTAKKSRAPASRPTCTLPTRSTAPASSMSTSSCFASCATSTAHGGGLPYRVVVAAHPATKSTPKEKKP